MANIPYLELDDVDSEGKLKQYVGKGKPVLVMAMGDFCGYCKQAKPAFEQLAGMLSKGGPVVPAFIQIDGKEPGERELGQKIKNWHGEYRGVPVYLGFDKTGKFLRVHDGGRDLESLKQFVMTL